MTSDQLGQRGRHHERRARTRRRLIDAAERVFDRDGFEDATIADITRDAGLGFGTFYNYFDSKEAVAEGVADRWAKALADELSERVHDTQDAAEALAATVLGIATWAKGETARALFLLNTVSARSVLYRHVGRLLWEIVRGGVASGRFPREHSEYAVPGLSSLLMGMLMTREGSFGERWETALAYQALGIAGLGRPQAEAAVAAVREAHG